MFNCNFPAQVDWIKNKILTSPNSSPKTINEKGMGIGLGWYNDPGCHLPTAHSTYNSNCSLLKLIWTSSIKFQALVYNQLNNLAVNSHWSLTELLKENVHSAERVKKWLLATARHESRVRYCRSVPADPGRMTHAGRCLCWLRYFTLVTRFTAMSVTRGHFPTMWT